MENTVRNFVVRALGETNEARVVADICAEMAQAVDAGDVCLRVTDETKLACLRAAETLVSVAPDDSQPFVLEEDRFYTRRNWRYEHFTRDRIKELAAEGGGTKVEIPSEIDQAWQPKPGQREAVILMNGSNYSILTGGPGTGKTFTITQAVKVALCKDPQLRIALAAPTGKAAARMTESFKDFKVRGQKLKATTLHALLHPNADLTTFKHNRQNPLDVNWLIVDEASMIDLPMMAKLLDALPNGCRLTLVGDEHQLASVERGRVFGDLCNAPWMKGRIARLSVSTRFVAGGEIDQLACAVNAGDSTTALARLKGDGKAIVYHSLDAQKKTKADRWPGFGALVKERLQAFVNANTPEEALEHLNDFRVLCAERHGTYGVEEVNAFIIRELAGSEQNPRCPVPLMITKNDSSLGVANGDVGVQMPADRIPEGDDVHALYLVASEEGGHVTARKVRRELLDNVEPSFAMTVHKSQGSEFRDVAIVLPPDGKSNLLTREILYTGITRTKCGVFLYGSDKAVSKACANKVERVTGLK